VRGNQGKERLAFAIGGRQCRSMCENYRNVLHRYLTVKQLDFTDMPRSPLAFSDNDSTGKLDLESLPFHSALERFEKSLILKALEYNQWRKVKAANQLGLPRRAFFEN